MFQSERAPLVVRRNMRSALLGLDASKSNTGWAIIDLKTGSPVLCGREDIDKLRKDSGKPPIGLEEAYMCTMERIADVSDRRDYKVEVVYVERHFTGRNRQVTILLAEAVGTARMAAHIVWPDAAINHFVPGTWKRAIGLAGNAPKIAYMPRAKELGWRFDEGNDDAAAAGCIASAGWTENEKGSYA